MTYTLQEQYNSKNFTPAAQVPAVFGEPRTVTSITIHHWGNNGQQFNIVRDFLCTNNTPTSAHYVVQDGLVACIVNTDDAAWHAGNAHGNATSIGIECRPEATDGDYTTIGELIASIRAAYGDLPLFPHNHWTSTACPGDYDLARLDALARGTVSAQASTITPIQESDMSYSDWPQGARLQLLEDIKNVLKPTQDRVLGGIPAGAARTAIPGTPRIPDNGDIYDIRQDIRGVANALVSIAQGVGDLKNKPAAGLDVKALAAELAPLLNTTQAHDFLVAFHNALPGA